MVKENALMSSMAIALREVRKSRRIKRIGSEEGITVKGSKLGFDLDEILHLTDSILPSVETDNSAFINQQDERLRKFLLPVTQEQISEAYTNGLHNYMKLRYRVARKTNPEEKNELKDEDKNRAAISAYTLDFVNSLRMSERLKIKPSRALELARLSYRHDPQAFASLIGEFPSFQQYVVLHAAIYYPAESREFLIKTKRLISELQLKFPEIGEELLTYVATNFPTRAEEYLLELEKLIPKLTEEFPEFAPVDVRMAVIHHSRNPEGFLENARKTYRKVTKEFPDLPDRAHSYSVLRYPLNSVKYLEDFRQILRELEAKFPDFSQYFILQAIYSRFKGAHKLLEDIKLKLSGYKQKYPTATESVLKQAFIFYPSDPETFIEANSK